MLKCKLPCSLTRLTALVGLWLVFTMGCSAGPDFFNENSQVSESKTSHYGSQRDKPRISQYLTMRDGVKIAIDLYLPDNLQPGQKIPTILHQTRYWRAVDYRWLVGLFKEDRPRGIIGRYAERFLQEGYAWVDVDVRGSGASFGSRPVAYSPEEIKDGAEIVDWIITQPWSNGNIGAMGISYSGGTAEMLLINQHPAVKAVAPMFSGFDLYSEIAFPGGIHLNWFTKTWTTINHRLDNNQLPVGGWMANLFVRGVRPVDHDAGDQLLSQAIKNHADNWSPYQEASGITFRDDPPPSRHAPNIDALSTQTYADQIAGSGATIYSYSGWFDGGYQLAAIKRHLRHRQNPDNKLILGPWDHGGKRHISPESLGPAPFDHAGELLKFFDKHLKGMGGDLPDDPPVRYYTMGEERWKESQHWPPPSTTIPFFFQDGARLSPDQPKATVQPDHYQVNPDTGSGDHSRWNTLVGISLKDPYPDRKERDRDLLVYTSEPLSQNMEVTGHPIATIYLSSSTPDTNLFVYLEDVTPEGDVHYVTEGQLRALHRKWTPPENGTSKSLPIPHRTFRRADAAPLNVGEVASLTLDLLPTSYQFKQGHRIRVALAGADIDHFQSLDGQTSVWEVWHTTDRPSRIDLPVVW
ncbi:MAG: CocE/NonD family hydrolase [Nitrospirales bacterium]